MSLDKTYKWKVVTNSNFEGIKMVCGVTKSIFGFLLVFAFSFYAMAGFERGNGGGGILCAGSDGEKSLISYDLYLGQTLHNRKYENLKSDPKLWFEKYEKKSPRRARAFIAWKKEFQEQSTWLKPGLHLVPTPDYAVRIVPDHCEYVQIIVQKKTDDHLSSTRYTVDSMAWSMLSNADQIALMMHEFLYNQATDTTDRRTDLVDEIVNLNSSLLSDNFESLNDDEMMKLLYAAGLRYFEKSGFSFDLNYLRFSELGIDRMYFTVSASGELLKGILEMDSWLPQAVYLTRRDSLNILDRPFVSFSMDANGEMQQEVGLSQSGRACLRLSQAASSGAHQPDCLLRATFDSSYHLLGVVPKQ